MTFAKLYQLANHPEIAPALRAELCAALLELERSLQADALRLSQLEKEVDILSGSGYLWK